MSESPATTGTDPEEIDALWGLHASPAPTGLRDWMSYDRPAEYESLQYEIQVPTRDGTRLSARLYRPGRGGQPAEGEFPGIVAQFTPYPIEMFALQHEYLSERGYNVLVANVRGSGASEGEFSDWFQPVEAEDNYDIIEWLADQSFSTGKIGQTGDSYGSVTTCRVATLNPPSLAAIAPIVSPTNIYEWIYPGGVPTSNGAWWASQGPVVDAAAHASTLQSFQDHYLFDDHWKQAVTTNTIATATAPALFVGGYYDIFKEGGFDALQQRPEQTWLLYGPWVHVIPFLVPGKVPVTDLNTIQLIASTGLSMEELSPDKSLSYSVFLHWFDYWLDERLGASPPPAPVVSFEDTAAAGAGQWIVAEHWPAPETTVTRRYPTPEGGLWPTPPPTSDTTYAVDPFDGPSASVLGSSPTDSSKNQALREHRSPNQQGRYAGGRTSFTTSPFESDTVVAGPVMLHLSASITAEDTYFVCKLEVVTADDRVLQIEVGSLRARLRTSRERLESIAAGVPHQYNIALGHTHWRFQAGERLRVTVSGGDFPRIMPTAPAGTVTIHHGDQTYLELPVLHS